MLYEYSYKPEPIFRSRVHESMRALTFGLELECDDGDIRRRLETTDKINELTDRVYCKKDGSLRTGFETVSHPGTLAHHMYEMPWRGICRKIQKAGFTSHDAGTCGLHIHVGREQLGRTPEERDMVIRKCIVIMNRYWRKIVKYTRRQSADINHWARCNPIAGYDEHVTITDAWAIERIPTTCNSNGSRYAAINCNNRATIEFRIFRGTLKRDTLIAAIQLVSNIVEYAQAKSWDEIQSGDWLDVCRFKHYNENDAYLALKGLAPACEPTYNTQRTPNFNGRN